MKYEIRLDNRSDAEVVEADDFYMDGPFVVFCSVVKDDMDGTATRDGVAAYKHASVIRIKKITGE